MTITTTTTSKSFTGDDSTVAFPLDFAFFGQDELEVVEQVIATGVETVKTLTTHYTVAGGSGAVGTVTAVTAPASTVKWTIRRKTKQTQETNLRAAQGLNVETVERMVDRAAAIVQETAVDFAGRSLVVPKSEQSALDLTLPAIAARKGAYLGFDGTTGKPVALVGAPPANVTVSAFMQTLLDDADAGAGRTTLGAIALAEVTAAALNYTAGQTGDVTVLADGATVTIDCSTAKNALEVTLGGNRAFAVSNLPGAGKRLPIVLVIKQDGTGSRTASWSASFKFPGAVVPVLSTAASAKDALAGWADSAGVFFGTIQKNVA